MTFIGQILFPDCGRHSAGKERRVETGVAGKGKNFATFNFHHYRRPRLIAKSLFSALLELPDYGQDHAVSRHRRGLAQSAKIASSCINFDLLASINTVQ